MIFKDAKNMREGKLKRLFAEEAFDELAELSRADALASINDLSDYNFCTNKRAAMSEEEMKPEPLLRGADLIEMGLRPGPIFGELLDAAYEEQLEGRITDKSRAMDFVKKLAREGEKNR
jgi:poly(A) polymerase